MKDRAEIVIIGGGAIGCAIAYHLAKMGKRDVLLIEKSGLTHGSTWHAAGLVGQLRSKRNLTRLMQYGAELYGRLEAETGQAVDWRPVGSLRLASSEERWREIRHTATTARSFGFELHLLSAKEAEERFPMMDPAGVVGAAFIPGDGYIDPSSLTQAYAKSARAGGVEIVQGVAVTELTVEDRRITRVVTDHGTVKAEVVVNAGGMWAREIAALAGVTLPAGAVEHQYMVTEKLPELPADLPTLRDPDKLFYLKPEVGGFAIGGWEADTVPFGERGVPAGFGRELLPGNFARFEQIAELAAGRLPCLAELGVRDLINGPIPVSADGEPVMGPACELDNFFVAAGFTAGIAASGGAGREMAHWIVEGRPTMDLWSFDLRRFGPHHAGTAVLHERAVECYGRYYAVHWPGDELTSARGGRRSPLYPALKAGGAVFGSKFGWERPNWFAAPGKDRVEKPSFERANWFERVGAEHRAVREAAGLIDLSSFAKFEVSGKDAFAFLQWLAAGDLDRPPGSVTYTQLCNTDGGIEADLTITRLAEDRFYIVTGSGSAVRDFDWISRNLRTRQGEGGRVVLRDVTSSKGVLSLSGPRAREVLAQLAEADVSNEAFPYMDVRIITMGYAPVLVLRLSYVGELGYELHVPAEYLAHLYERLKAAGAPLGLVDFGYRALDSLRLEKGYLAWGSDITPDYSPYHAGLGRLVARNKGDFLGAEALARIRTQGPDSRICTFRLEEARSVFGGEAILKDGRVIGVTTSGGYGYSLGAAIVLGHVPAAELDEGDEGYAIEAAGEVVPATLSRRALYDPERERLLA